jgi:Na+-transporting NADH:ubiquinone oxidoreductase subunit A
MKPSMRISEGDRVSKGQTLFVHKQHEAIAFTSPVSGVVTAVQRGDKRVFQNVEIRCEGSDAVDFGRHDRGALASLGRAAIEATLLASGLWTALRTRPFSKIPAPGSEALALFVNAMDTNPLAADPAVVIAGRSEHFTAGLEVLRQLTPKTFLSKVAGSNIPTANGVQVEEFAGVHPAGLVGTHIHFLMPASGKRIVWHIGYQDVIAIGALFLTGQLGSERVIALAGPSVRSPRLLRTVAGASIDDLVKGELTDGEHRVISGSVLSGHHAKTFNAFLGRYHTQISVLPEGRERTLLDYLRLGADRYSAHGVYASRLLGGKNFRFTTSSNGSPRAMVPVGAYETVMPLDILPTYLLRYLIVGDTEMAAQMGALELDEEDLALCTFVCPGKYEYGPILRDVLTRIEQEG